MPDGKITSIDNTRVLAAREAGIDLKVRVWGHDEVLPESMARRFRNPLDRQVFAETWGEAANFRMMGQPEQFVNQYLPYGSIDDPMLSYNLNTDLINLGR